MNLLEGNPVPNMKINPRAKQGFQYGGHEISGGMPCSIELRGSQLSLPFEFLGSLMYLALLQYIYILYQHIYIYQYIYSTIPATSTCSAIHIPKQHRMEISHHENCETVLGFHHIFFRNTTHLTNFTNQRFTQHQDSAKGEEVQPWSGEFLGHQDAHRERSTAMSDPEHCP